MNLPENVSAAAKKVYEVLSGSEGAKDVKTIASSYSQQPVTEERYKAIATADSLIVKGIASVEKGNDASNEDVYKLVKSSTEIGPNEEADANDDYVQKTDANEEEQRMIKILEEHNKNLPAAELFDIYLKEQMPANSTSASNEEITAALQELTEAGVVSANGESYQIKS